jgi:hypothetical protein
MVVIQKSAGLAAILSFFWCGLGQIYAGQVLKGILLMIMYPVCIWAGVALTFFGALAAGASNSPSGTSAGGGLVAVGGVFLLIGVSLWIFGMVNAHRSVERYNRQHLAQFV